MKASFKALALIFGSILASVSSTSFAALIGVDLGSGSSIPNWTNITSAGTYNNLLDENGIGSGINLVITSALNPFSVTPAASTVPQPSPSIAPSLSGIDGNVFQFGGTFTAEYTGLIPGNAYSFWLFGLRSVAPLGQTVTITTDSVVLNYSQAAGSNQLMINDQVGSNLLTLGDYADTVYASSTGTISIQVVGTGTSGAPFTVAGLALAVPEPDSLALFGLGALPLTSMTRKRKTQRDKMR